MLIAGDISIRIQFLGILTCTDIKLFFKFSCNRFVLFFSRLNSNGFPTDLLPTPVSNSNLIVGYTQFQWYSIKPNIPVVVAFGDLQSMMHLALKDNPNSIGIIL